MVKKMYVSTLQLFFLYKHLFFTDPNRSRPPHGVHYMCQPPHTKSKVETSRHKISRLTAVVSQFKLRYKFQYLIFTLPA